MQTVFTLELLRFFEDHVINKLLLSHLSPIHVIKASAAGAVNELNVPGTQI